MWFDNSVVRIISVLLVMLIVGVVRYALGSLKLKKESGEDKAARKQLVQSAKKSSLIGGFLYMVAMVSVAGLFI